MMESTRILHALRVDERGTAAIELGLCLTVLCAVALNGIEFARWFSSRMMVANVAQAAVQNAWQTCDTTKLPATTNCPGLAAAISASRLESRLGTGVTLATGYPQEAYYCVNPVSGVLTKVGEVDRTKPANCAAVLRPAEKPGTYLTVAMQYTYVPLFPSATFITALPSAISGTARVRLH